MQGFSNLLKNFGDSATPPIPPLEPRLRAGQNAATAPPPPKSFDTPVGKRRVPRDRDPKKPSYEMIKDAREGKLTGFPRTGGILRASDFIGMVNPKTAVITLDDLYYFETRCLNAKPLTGPPMSSTVSFKKTADTGADDEKTLRNLYYINLNHDELPSFHFWTKSGDVDPVKMGEPYDWGKHFDENPLSPEITAKLAMLEKKRTEKVQPGAEEQQNTQNEQPLGFLDRYNDSKGPTEGQPSVDNGPIPGVSASPVVAQPPVETEVLLQFNRGGMYLREFTHKALYAMACWLLRNEEEDEDVAVEDQAENGPTEPSDIFLDILEHGKDPRVEKIVSVSRASNRNFQEKIKPFLGQPDIKFRIRSLRYPSSWNKDSGFDSGGVGDLKWDLKLVRPNVGYCYCSANWHATQHLGFNSERFEKAIRFLFDWESSAHPNSNHLSLDIPEHGSFDLNRDLNVVVDAKVQKVFAELSETPATADSRPTKIFIRDVPVEDDTEGSDLLGTSQHRGENWKEATKIRGGPDLPSIQPQLLTVSDTSKLKEQLRIAEASIAERDDLQERLATAEAELSEMNGLKEQLKMAEARARLIFYCPFCSSNWAGMKKEQQRAHLRVHQKDIIHQPAEQECPQPNCTAWLGEGQPESTYEAISKHLRSHIDEEHAEDGICVHPGCHTNMYALTAEQQEEHELVHGNNGKTEEERNQLLEQIKSLDQILEKQHPIQEQVGTLEDNVKEREVPYDRLQRNVRFLQEAANERNQLQENLAHMAEERNSWQNQANKEANQGKEVAKDSKQPNQPQVSRLLYCNVCLKSVNTMSADIKSKHAEKCKTSVSNFPLLTPTEAKGERERRKQNHNVVTPQAQEGAEVPDTGRTRKQKASAKAAPSESQQDAAEDADTSPQPEASKPTGRRTLKRKNDTFKPPKEDESENEEPESPRKKPKLKAKVAKKDEATARTTRSTRNKDVYQPSKEEEEAQGEPSSSAQGSKKRKRAAAATPVSKKTKTKK